MTDMLPDSRDDAMGQKMQPEEVEEKRSGIEVEQEGQVTTKGAIKLFCGFIGMIPFKMRCLLFGALALIVVYFFGVALPLNLDSDETQYVSVQSLKSIVDIKELTAVDYIYRGVAEKHSTILWIDRVDYRVKYEVHVGVHYDLSKVEFTTDNESKIAIAYLPEAGIDEPQLVGDQFGYLPENATADLKDIWALCTEDAAKDIDASEIRAEAEKSIQDTVEALTLPLLDDGWQLEFKELSEYPGEKEDQNEAE